MKKYLKFNKITPTNYQVRNNKREFLGDIYLEKKKWWFYPCEGEVRAPIAWDLNCLGQLRDFIGTL